MSTMADKRPRRTRRRFTDDYKAGAVRLVLDEGKSVAAAARDLGLTESSLRNWVEQARADRTHGKTGLTTAEREELARLRKENRILQEEREILKNFSRTCRASCGTRNWKHVYPDRHLVAVAARLLVFTNPLKNMVRGWSAHVDIGDAIRRSRLGK
jgi:transposase